MLAFQNLSFVFGDKQLSCKADVLKTTQKLSEVMVLEPFASLSKENNLSALVFPRQVHGISALTLTDKQSLEKALSGHKDADIVSTNLENVGIGVMTADCLPLILYSSQKNAVAVVHAGWRGTVLNVAAAAVEHLKTTYGCDPQKIFAFFGPCAHVESYEASPELRAALQNSPYRDSVLEQRGSQAPHFNMVRMNQRQLEFAGILSCNCFLAYSGDTITDSHYWSYRRDGDLSGRQITLAFLKGKSHEDTCCTLSYRTNHS